MNIKPYIKNDVIIGYNIQRRENGKVCHKYFTNSKNTPEYNLNHAEQWLNQVKNNIINDDNLPKNIYKSIDHKNNILNNS